jgi:hypothetical protein
MKVYLTKEGKEELEAKIEEIEKERFYGSELNLDYRIGQQKVYKELLSQCIVLPVEDDWEDAIEQPTGREKSYYPSGVIIEPKQ